MPTTVVDLQRLSAQDQESLSHMIREHGHVLVLVHPFFYQTDAELLAILSIIATRADWRTVIAPLDSRIASAIMADSRRYGPALQTFLASLPPMVVLLVESQSHVAKSWAKLQTMAPHLRFVAISTVERSTALIEGRREEIPGRLAVLGARRVSIAGCYVCRVPDIPTQGCVTAVADLFRSSAEFGDAAVRIEQNVTLLVQV